MIETEPTYGPCSEQCTDARAHCQSPEHYDDLDQARFTYEGAMARDTLPVPVEKRARSAR